jgi:hypothetical protein
MGPRVLLALLGVVLGLGVGELAARVAGIPVCVDAPGVFYLADAALGWRQRPDLVGWAAFCRGKPVPATPVETDARGFRNPGRPLEKPPGTARLLLLGGNVPQALGLPWALSLAGIFDATGPIASVAELADARGPGGVAPASGAALASHLADVGRGAARVAWGIAKLLVMLARLNLVTPDVLASAGDAVSRPRLWAWLGETTVYLWALYSGLSDLGVGLAAMAGVRVPENFHAPRRATTPAGLWRRALATVTVQVDRFVVRPVGRRLGMRAGVLAGCLAGAGWYAWAALVLYGLFGVRPTAWLGIAGWELAQAAGLVVLSSRPRRAAPRVLGALATQLLLALTWVPLLAFPHASLGTTLRIYARLVGLR